MRQTSGQLLIKSWEKAKILARSKYKIVEQKKWWINFIHSKQSSSGSTCDNFIEDNRWVDDSLVCVICIYTTEEILPQNSECPTESTVIKINSLDVWGYADCRNQMFLDFTHPRFSESEDISIWLSTFQIK